MAWLVCFAVGARTVAAQTVPHATPAFPNAADPDYGKAYAEYRQRVQSRPVVSPALGYTDDGSASNVASSGVGGKLASITDSIGSSVKKGVASVGNLLKPNERVNRQLEPTSVFNDARPSPETYVAMARLHEESGRLEHAEKHYLQALDASPQHLGALLGYAHLKDRTGKLSEAIELYQTACQTHPQVASAHNDMGLCCARAGRFDEAVTALSRAVHLQPRKALYRNNLAIVLVEVGQEGQALMHLRAVHAEGVARFNLAQLILRKGDPRGAADQFAAAARADPNMQQARMWLAELSRQGIEPRREARIASGGRAPRNDGSADRALPPTAVAPRQPSPAPMSPRIGVPSRPPPQNPVAPRQPDYGNFPLPPGRQPGVRRPDAGIPAPPSRPVPPEPRPQPRSSPPEEAGAPGPYRAVAPEPSPDGRPWPPVLMRSPARDLSRRWESHPEEGSPVPRERAATARPPETRRSAGRPVPGEDVVAPLPPVAPEPEPVEPLPPVESGP